MNTHSADTLRASADVAQRPPWLARIAPALGVFFMAPLTEDGRAHLVSLTEQGATLAAQVVPEHEALVAEYLALLPPEDRHSLHDVLRRLNQALGSE